MPHGGLGSLVPVLTGEELSAQCCGPTYAQLQCSLAKARARAATGHGGRRRDPGEKGESKRTHWRRPSPRGWKLARGMGDSDLSRKAGAKGLQ